MHLRSITPVVKWFFIFMLMAGMFSACRDHRVEPAGNETKQLLQQMGDNGILLNSYSKEGEDYVFHFETGDIRVQASEIQSIRDDRAAWKTFVGLANGTQFSIPSKGDALDFMVEGVKLNPSGFNPLAAIADVQLPAAGRVRVTVQGKEGTAGNITHLCAGQTVRQQVPILGLYQDYENKVELTFTDKEGNKRGSTVITIKTAPLSVAGFPAIQTMVSKPQQLEPGMNLVSYPGESELDVSTPYMIDAAGEVRWILLLKSSPDLQHFSASIGLKRMKNGHFLSGDGYEHRLVEIDMFGNLVHKWDLAKLGYAFHHEVSEAENGNFLVTVTKNAARLKNGKPRVNDHIIELNPASGSVVNEWDLATMLDTSRYDKPDGITPPAFSQTPGNWAHNNSIGERNGDLLATARYQGIFSFTHSGSVNWIISPHKGWSAAYSQYLLQPVDEQGQTITDPKVIAGETGLPGFDWAWGPHTPVSLPNGNILVFDNGYNRHFIPNALTQNYSRVVEYKVNAAARTVQQVWSYGQARGANGFAMALSSVQYLKQTGHVLFCPGMGAQTSKGFGGRIVEIDPVTKEVFFDVEITPPSNSAFHRVTRLAIYPDNL